jgi:uncharacterized protein (TIGR02996 family)
MADILAIISKAQFEAAHPKAKEGDALGFTKYVSTHAALEAVRSGGSIFLVTVRPPDERLWLLAELVDPKHDGKAWVSAASKLAVRDVTALISKLKFVNGKGISAKKGALGMSLQTPRQLSADDTALLRGSSAATVKAKSAVKAEPAAAKPTAAAVKAEPAPPKPAAVAGSSALSLPAVLAEWRTTRAPELEALIETLSKHHARAYPALDPEADDYDAQWTARANAATPEGLAPLLPGLWSDPRGSIPMRLRKLLDLGADPRLGEALLTMIDEPPLTASSNFSAWSLLFKSLPSMVDTRAKKRLQARAKKKGGDSQFWPKLTAWIEGALEDLPEPAALTKEQLASVAKRQKEATALLKGPAPAGSVKEKTSVVQPMKGSPRETLEAALSEAKAGKFLAVLEPLRQYWVVTRAPAAADLLNKFAQLGAPGQPRFDEGKAAAIHATWLKTAKTYDAALVTPLLDAILKGTLADAEERMEAMLSWPPDPRVADCMVNVMIFGRSPYIGARPQLWKRAYDLLVLNADPRYREKLEQNAARLERAAAFDRNRAERPHASRTLAPYVTASSSGRAPSADEEKLLAALATAAAGAKDKSKASSKPDQELALLLTINAAWDDPTPRLVYADFLAERGDPRAEFINLSLALARGEKVKSKLEAWTKANERALNGGVKAVGFTYHLGLPMKGGVNRYKKVAEADIDTMVEDLRWATVQELIMNEDPANAKLMAKGALHGVKRILNVRGEELMIAAKREFPWLVEEIELVNWKAAEVPAAFPHLTAVELPMWEAVDEGLFGAPFMKGVKRLTMGATNSYGAVPIEVLVKHATKLPKLETVDVTTSAFSFKIVPSNGKVALTFSLGSQPSVGDDYFVTTLAELKRIPKGAVAKFELVVLDESNGRKVKPAVIAAAREATAHLL